MKKGKSTGIQLLEPTVYWERKLDINFETEFFRYKNLCIKKLKKKERRKLDGAYYNTYSDWEQKMIAAISLLNESEIYEYIHFLYGRTKNSNFIIQISSSFLFPIITSFVCSLVFKFSDALTSVTTFLSFLIIVIFFLGVIIKLCSSITEYKNDSLYYSFYTDLARIAENQYKKLIESQKAK